MSAPSQPAEPVQVEMPAGGDVGLKEALIESMVGKDVVVSTKGNRRHGYHGELVAFVDDPYFGRSLQLGANGGFVISLDRVVGVALRGYDGEQGVQHVPKPAPPDGAR